MSTPTVSAIINCLNAAPYLREAIDSVFAQTFTDWEVVYWDNGSTDGSQEIARSYGDRVRCFQSERTFQLGKARNLAMQQARGQFLAFLDADDIWLPRKLEKQIPLFANPQVGLVFSDTYFFDKTGREWPLYGDTAPADGRIFTHLLSHYYLSMDTVVLRRTALDALDHWFDETLTIVEEMDLFSRVAFHHELACVHEPLSKWRIHMASSTHTRPDLFVTETEHFLAKIRRMVGNSTEHDAAIEQRRCEVERYRAKLAWTAGRSGEARRVLRRILHHDRKAALMYPLTFFPFSMAAGLRRLATGRG